MNPNKCPDINSEEYKLLLQAVHGNHGAAFQIFRLNRGYYLDSTPEGKPSILFEDLTQHFGGDTLKAMRYKALIYSNSFSTRINPWLNKFILLDRKLENKQLSLIEEENNEEVEFSEAEQELLYRVDELGEPIMKHVLHFGQMISINPNYKQDLIELGQIIPEYGITTNQAREMLQLGPISYFIKILGFKPNEQGIIKQKITNGKKFKLLNKVKTFNKKWNCHFSLSFETTSTGWIVSEAHTNNSVPAFMQNASLVKMLDPKLSQATTEKIQQIMSEIPTFLKKIKPVSDEDFANITPAGHLDEEEDEVPIFESITEDEYNMYEKRLFSTINRTKNSIYTLQSELKILDKTSLEAIKKTAVLRNLIERQVDLEKKIEQLHSKDPMSLLKVTLKELDKLNNILKETSQLTDNYLLSGVLDQIKFYGDFLEVINKEVDISLEKKLTQPESSLLQQVISKFATVQKTKKEAFKKIQKELVLNNRQYENLFINKSPAEIDTILVQLFDNYESGIGNKLDYFSGAISSFAHDTQNIKLVKLIFDEKLMYNKSISNRLITKLKDAAKNIENFDNRKFLQIDKDTGEFTGNLVDVFSTSFRKKLGEFSELYKGAYYQTHEAKRYRKKCEFLQKEADIIDFRRLKVVRDTQIVNLDGTLGKTFLEQYGERYSYLNEYTEQELMDYENSLKQKLGKSYDVYINKVINDLQTYERTVALTQFDTTEEKFLLLIKRSPWILMNAQFNKQGQILTDITGKVDASPLRYPMESGQEEFIFPTITNVTLIPKNSIDYDERFNELSDEEYELWNLLRDIYTTVINPVFTEKFNDDMTFGKIPAGFLEIMTKQKDINRLIKWSKGEVKSMWFDTLDKKGDNVLKLYQDNTKDDMNNLREILRALPDEKIDKEALALKISINLDRDSKIKAIAQRKVMSEYSADIMQVTAVLLNYVALQKTKEESFPSSTILSEENKKVTGEHSISQKKLENFNNRIIKGEHVTHHKDKDSFLGFSFLKKKDGSFKYIQTILQKAGHIPLLKSVLNENTLRKVSEADAALLKYVEELQDKSSFEHNYSFNLFDKTHKFTTIFSFNKEKQKYFKGREYSSTKIEITQEEFEKEFAVKLQEIQSKTGIDFTVGGIVNGILQTLIIKGMALNFKGGIFNRQEGKLSAYKMDATGYYWTEGNFFYADNFMIMFNVKRLGMKLLYDEDNIKLFAQMQIFTKLLNATELINDRRNEIDRNHNVSQYKFEKRKELLDPMQFAVSNSEIKNQGAVVLCLLMDTEIVSADGTMTVPLFDKETMTFPAHTLDANGNLILKDEFRTEANIINWENFSISSIALNNSYQEFYHKAASAIARTQGNYSNTDTSLALTNAYIKPLMLFKRWMPENLLNKFAVGGDYDPFMKKMSKPGVYTSALKSPGSIAVLVGLNGLTNFSLNPITLLANMGLLGGAIVGAVQNIINGKSEKANIGLFTQNLAMMKQIFLELINVPGLFLNLKNKKTIAFTKKHNAFAKFENKVTFSGQTITAEDIGNFKYLAREMALKLILVLAGLVLKALLWDDDDEEDSDSYQRKVYNFVNNQGNKLLSTLFMFSNPRTLLDDIGNAAFVRYSDDFIKGLESIQSGETDKWWDNFLDVTPVPRSLYKGDIPILSAFTFWKEPKEYVTYQNALTDRYIKGREYEAKKHLTSLRGMLAKDIANDILDEDNQNLPAEFLALRGTTESKKALITEVRKLLPYKEEESSYIEATQETYDLIDKLGYHYPIQRMFFKQIDNTD